MDSPTKKAKRSSGGKSSDYLPYTYSDKETEVAMYYGFIPINQPEIQKDNSRQAKSFLSSESDAQENKTLSVLEEKIALLRTYEEKNLSAGPQPAMIYYKEKSPGGSRKKDRSEIYRYNLDILGSSKSIAEATLIQTTLEMLRDDGVENLYVDINSIGDKESFGRFHREMIAYYRKNANDLSSRCRQIIKKDIFAASSCGEEKCAKLAEEAPRSIAFLSERASLHFKEVLEYLETLDIPYKINHRLLGNSNFITDTIFEIKSIGDGDTSKADSPLAFGFRYNSLAKKIGLKRDLPAIGISIVIKKKPGAISAVNHKIKKPKLFFVQIGFDAKLKSLKIIAALRQAKIPLFQALSRDKMESQLTIAESLKIPYVLILGQKEALDDTVIVRNMLNRSQVTVPIAELAVYLKKLVG